MPLISRACEALAAAVFLIFVAMTAPPVQAAGECARITNVEDRLVCIEQKIDAASSPSRPPAVSPPAVSSPGVSSPAAGGPTCASGQSSCAGACVDTSTDLANCGRCGGRCPTGGTCLRGMCGCPAGQTVCASSNSCVPLGMCR
jgi:stigma-specific protein Stig1